LKKIIVLLTFLFCQALCFADQLIIEPDQGRAPLLSFIDHAKSNITLVTYGLTDSAFIDALEKAKHEGKSVDVMLEPSPYRAANENQFAIANLHKDGIEVKKPNPEFKFLHQKTFLIDDYAIIMTFNLTHSTFKNERNFALILQDPLLVKKIRANLPDDRLVWSPDNSREKITDFIRSAHDSIKIYAQNVADYKIIGELAHAARKGVDVKILTSNKLSPKKLHYLTKAGVQVQLNHHLYIHAKVILIDEKRALLGSINLTQTSLDKNRELSIITDKPEIIRILNETFTRDFL